jgi:hypothetical protein
MTVIGGTQAKRKDKISTMKNVKTIMKTGAILMVAATLFFAACKKNNSSASEDVGYGQDQAQLEKTSSDAQTISDQAYASTNGALAGYRTAATTLSTCAVITKDTVNGVITVNFGTSDCPCNDGSYRRGEVIIHYTGKYLQQGSVHTITYSNFFVNDNQVTGSKTVTNTGTNVQGQTSWSVVVNDSVILANNGGIISWTGNRTRTMTSSAPVTYSITGSGTLTRANGAVISYTITNPLIFSTICEWVEQGTVSFTLANGKTAIIDYGNGVCDALATVSYNGKTYNVTLKK